MSLQGIMRNHKFRNLVKKSRHELYGSLLKKEGENVTVDPANVE